MSKHPKYKPFLQAFWLCLPFFGPDIGEANSAHPTGKVQPSPPGSGGDQLAVLARVQKLSKTSLQLKDAGQLELSTVDYSNGVKVITPLRIQLEAQPAALEIIFVESFVPPSGHYAEPVTFDYSPAVPSAVQLRVIEGFVEAGLAKTDSKVTEESFVGCEAHEWKALARLQSSEFPGFLKRFAAKVCVSFESPE